MTEFYFLNNHKKFSVFVYKIASVYLHSTIVVLKIENVVSMIKNDYKIYINQCVHHCCLPAVL